ncbi:methanobactin export MATE transporter MbnM [Thioalkalivibrio nitratireducens]|uniref:methanobactin export MATE transporter MbnM n=1 Tax=Thioalkalivibrio nitratireducens TaxID=186931 RepID=UPI0012EEBE14|nr:methanobactin export MATE transporter MbnM [Thioalkalivibrio nitratireducens]
MTRTRAPQHRPSCSAWPDSIHHRVSRPMRPLPQPGRLHRIRESGAWGVAATGLALLLLLPGCGSETFVDDHGARLSAFEYDVPERIPLPVEPEGNPMTEEKFQLGRHLFFDTRLSANGTIACASCHHQDKAFADGRALPVGATGEVHPRNSQGLVNAAYFPSLTWANPVLLTIEQQIMIPLFGEEPVEHGINDSNRDQILYELETDPVYQRLFADAFPDDDQPFTFHRVVQALASFVRGITAFSSRFDRYQEGDRDALTASERQGMELFFSERMECFHCHGGYNFTNSVYDRSHFFREMPFHNTGLFNIDGLGGYPEPNTGVHEITGRPGDMGRFRAPSLRNVALTAPYMHDGSIETLEEVIQTYAAGGRNVTTGPHVGDGRMNPLKDGFVVGFQLSDAELQAVLDFLHALTDESVTTNPRFSNPWEEQE